ncbi:MAG: hypothetical protein JWN56_2657 [Sphingobacteriales bacterium]|nr:hypothetical protein [Sphingobacteriales bacterium]
MKDKLSRFVIENREEFDEFDVPAEVWGKIESKLNAAKPKKSINDRVIKVGFLLKIAATIIVVASFGLFFWIHNIKPTAEVADFDPDLAKQQVHYASLIEMKRNEIKTFKNEDPSLYKEFSSEINKMESNYEKLQKDLINSPNPEETVKAMIRNLQIQTEVLSQQLNIIQQIKKVKQQQKDETKSI